MEIFTDDELNEASKAITSMVRKCEKAQEKETLGASQRTMLTNRIRALHISAALIAKELEYKLHL